MLFLIEVFASKNDQFIRKHIGFLVCFRREFHNIIRENVNMLFNNDKNESNRSN